MGWNVDTESIEFRNWNGFGFDASFVLSTRSLEDRMRIRRILSEMLMTEEQDVLVVLNNVIMFVSTLNQTADVTVSQFKVDFTEMIGG